MIDKCCESSYYRMTTVQNVILRVSIVLGMVAATVTVLYFTPLADHSFESCDRPCHDLDWPMICRIKLIIEEPQFYQRICKNCTNLLKQCTTTNHCYLDETIKPKFLINGQLSGPSIQVCQNDVVVVDVVNRLPSHSLTVHWRGQPNDETPFMDGVPMITQCPITSFTTFQYKFRASTVGTHFYHTYTNTDRFDGLFGSLIVRQADKLEPHRKLYDIDEKDNMILLINENDNNSLMINNKRYPIEIFNVKPWKRYRFRSAYIGGRSNCPISITIDNHLIKIINLDGNPIKPYEASRIVLNNGERIDFIVKTDQLPMNEYFLNVQSNCKNRIENITAIIRYQNFDGETNKFVEKLKNQRIFDTSMCGDTQQLGRICLNDIKSLMKMPEELRKVDKVIYLVFGSRTVNIEDNFQMKINVINNLTFTYPSSPLLTQYKDISSDIICDSGNMPKSCQNSTICQCVHIEKIPLGSSTEIILINQGVENEEEQIFHLHGQQFYVIGMREYDQLPTFDQIKSIKHHLLQTNLNNPVLKDTIRIRKNSIVAIRFLANNPGFWMLRDENANSWTRGMDIVLQIGDIDDVPASPTKFPVCGDFIGPDFFFI